MLALSGQVSGLRVQQLGSACATTSITTFLTVLGSKASTQSKNPAEAEESAPLLGEAPASDSEKAAMDAPRLAGYIGLASGLGALLAGISDRLFGFY